jgi:hypothetical protein
MATETPNLKLKIITDDDHVSQELVNANSEILDAELMAIKEKLSDVDTIKDDLNQAEADIATLSTRITNNAQNISSLAIDKEDKANKGQPDGYASLDATGKVPITQLPANVKEMRVVADIAAKNAISGADLYDGLRVRVLDAIGDPTVASGWAEYVYDAAAPTWIKLSEKESLDVVMDWSNMQNIPALLQALTAPDGKLLYQGTPVYNDVRNIAFIGGDSQVVYPWTGQVQSVQITVAEVREIALDFKVEIQAQSDFIAKVGLWQAVSGDILTLPAGEVYKTFSVLDDITAGDVIRASTVGDDTGVTFQVTIKNN